MGGIGKMMITLVLALALLNSAAARATPEDMTMTSAECWNALLQLKSCSKEIIMFFLNGEADHIGPDCCRAIEIITRQCWPAMLTSLGFTPEEGYILRGYCDAITPALPPFSAHPPIANEY